MGHFEGDFRGILFGAHLNWVASSRMDINTAGLQQKQRKTEETQGKVHLRTSGQYINYHGTPPIASNEKEVNTATESRL